MSSAWPDPRSSAPGRLARRGAAFAAVLLALAAPGATAGAAPSTRLEAPWPVPLSVSLPGAAVPIADAGRRPSARRLAAATWWGGDYVAGTGERVRVFVSEAYPRDEAVARGWADFFAGLLHGEELARVTAYFAPLDEVAALCGPRALGCYAGDRIVAIGDSAAGVPPAEVAAHEYGHHVARNRLNPPWLALDWGPKRWASENQVCHRSGAGELRPGAGGDGYALNPAEGFAEAFRVVNERRAGAAASNWPIVDPTFYPDDRDAAALGADVATPWAPRPATTVRIVFRAGGSRVATFPLETPLDGELTATMRLRSGATHELSLLSETRTTLASGLWASTERKVLRFLVCGQRRLSLRVVRKGPPGPVAVTVATP